MASKVTEKIVIWKQINNKVIIGIDGYSGAGKTSLLKYISKHNPHILPVHLDDFILPRKIRDKLLTNAKNKSKVYEFQWYDWKKVKRLIYKYKHCNQAVYTTKVFNYQSGTLDKYKDFNLSKRMLIIEGVFLFNPKLLDRLLDKRIYLQTSLKAANKRRKLREMNKWRKKYVPETNKHSYVQFFKLAYKDYQKLHKPDKKADLRIKIED